MSRIIIEQQTEHTQHSHSEQNLNLKAVGGKMASTKTLEDILSSEEMDESAVSALVGSLESQLASLPPPPPPPPLLLLTSSSSSTTNAVTSQQHQQQQQQDIQNHVSSAVSTSTAAATIVAVTTTTMVASTTATATDNNTSLVFPRTTTIINNNNNNNHQISTPQTQTINQINHNKNNSTSSSKVVVANSAISSSGAIIHLPTGSMPASGFVNQQFTTVAAVNPNSSTVLQGRTTTLVTTSPATTASTLPNGNAGSGTNAIVMAVQHKMTAVTAKTATSPAIVGPGPGNAGGGMSVNLSGGIGAMQHLAAVAARQPPLIIPTSQPGGGLQQHQQPLQQQQQQQPTLQRDVYGCQQQYDYSYSPRSYGYNRCVQRPTSSYEETASDTSRPHWSTLSSCAYRGHTTTQQPQQTVITMAGRSLPTQNYVQVSSASATTGHQQQQQQQQQQSVNMVMSNQQILQGVQIVNFNPQHRAVGTAAATAAQTAQGQKTLAPRVVIGNPVRIGQQVIGARPGTPGVPGTLQNTITLQPGMMRGTLLVKTDNGQYQLVNVGPALTNATVGGTYRLQSVPPGTQGPVRPLTSQQVTVTLPVSHANQQHVRLHQQVVHPVLQAQQPSINMVSTAGMLSHTTTHSVTSAASVMQQHIRPGHPAATVVSTQPLSVTVARTTAPTTTTTAQSTAASQMSPDTAKKKCKNFLSTLLRLASDQPEQVATNVRNLIQGLIDGNVPPEDFTNQLQRELNSSPQPCLIPFLKKSLPYLRQSLMTRELTIDGVRAPMMATLAPPQTSTTATTGIQPLSSSMCVPQLHMMTRAPLQPATTTTASHIVPSSGLQVMHPTTVASHHVRMFGSTPITSMTTATTTMTDLVNQSHRHPAPGPRYQSPTTTACNILTPSSVRPTAAERKSHSASTSRAAKAAAAKAAAAAAAAATAAAQSAASAALSTTSASTIQSKEKEKRSYVSTLKDDDDINDVAAMGGVNLIEESARIMAANAEFVGTQIRSCKDENFLFTAVLMRRIRGVAAKFGLEEPSAEVAAIVSHATQLRLKDVVEKLGVIADHRLDIVKGDPRHEVTQDVKSQLKFLEELDKLEKKRHEEQEREILMRAAKSRSKLEDPEQLKLKQKAKEMQRAELEEMRQKEANMTALLAIGPRKKFKPDTPTENNGPQVRQKLSSRRVSQGSNLGNVHELFTLASTSTSPSSSLGNLSSTTRPQILRPRVKRVNLRDLVFLMEQERHTSRSVTLYKAFLK